MWLANWVRGLLSARTVVPPRQRTGRREPVQAEPAEDDRIDASTNDGSASTVRAAGLAVHGEPATAAVLAVTPVDVPWGLLAGPAASVVDLDLQVTRSDGVRYPVRVRVGFSTPQRRALIATVGATVPVRVDPDNPTRVAIDLARLNTSD